MKLFNYKYIIIIYLFFFGGGEGRGSILKIPLNFFLQREQYVFKNNHCIVVLVLRVSGLCGAAPTQQTVSSEDR